MVEPLVKGGFTMGDHQIHERHSSEFTGVIVSQRQSKQRLQRQVSFMTDERRLKIV
jgi:hypothetical protein